MLYSLLPAPQDFPLPPPPAWYQHFFLAICIFSIFLPQGPIRFSTGIVLLALLYHATFWTYSPTFNEYTIVTTCMTTFFAWVDFVACHDLERDFWMVKIDKKGGTVEKRAPSGAWEKLKWSTLFWFGYRKIGWNIQVSSIPPAVPITYPRSRFLTDMLFKTLKLYITLDVASNLLRILAHSRQTSSLLTESLSTQILTGWATATRAYSGMSMVYHLFAFLSVLFNFASPNSWPPLNGSFRSNFYSIRQTWGQLWHQFIRRYCSSAGLAVTRALGFKKGSFGSKYTQLWVGFMVTALMHAPPAVWWDDGGTWQAVAFLSQPAAIMVEDFLIWGGKRMGIRESGWTRLVGYLWVILWFSYSLRFWVATVPVRYYEGDELPSLIRYILRRFEIKLPNENEL